MSGETLTVTIHPPGSLTSAQRMWWVRATRDGAVLAEDLCAGYWGARYAAWRMRRRMTRPLSWTVEDPR